MSRKTMLAAVSALAIMSGTVLAPAASLGLLSSRSAEAASPVSAQDMIGRNVIGADGQPLGKVSDVVVDSASGNISKVVLASGGFLGIGTKTVALDFTEVDVRPEQGLVAKSVTQGDIEAMPEFEVASQTKPLDAAPAADTMVTPSTGAAPAAPEPAPGAAPMEPAPGTAPAAPAQ